MEKKLEEFNKINEADIDDLVDRLERVHASEEEYDIIRNIRDDAFEEEYEIIKNIGEGLTMTKEILSKAYHEYRSKGYLKFIKNIVDDTKEYDRIKNVIHSISRNVEVGEEDQNINNDVIMEDISDIMEQEKKNWKKDNKYNKFVKDIVADSKERERIKNMVHGISRDVEDNEDDLDMEEEVIMEDIGNIMEKQKEEWKKEKDSKYARFINHIITSIKTNDDLEKLNLELARWSLNMSELADNETLLYEVFNKTLNGPEEFESDEYGNIRNIDIIKEYVDINYFETELENYIKSYDMQKELWNKEEERLKNIHLWDRFMYYINKALGYEDVKYHDLSFIIGRFEVNKCIVKLSKGLVNIDIKYVIIDSGYQMSDNKIAIISGTCEMFGRVIIITAGYYNPISFELNILSGHVPSFGRNPNTLMDIDVNTGHENRTKAELEYISAIESNFYDIRDIEKEDELQFGIINIINDYVKTKYHKGLEKELLYSTWNDYMKEQIPLQVLNTIQEIKGFNPLQAGFDLLYDFIYKLLLKVLKVIFGEQLVNIVISVNDVHSIIKLLIPFIASFNS